MRKPIIGIVLLVDIERKSYWMLPGYMKGIEQAGGIPLMIPLTSNEENLHNWQMKLMVFYILADRIFLLICMRRDVPGCVGSVAGNGMKWKQCYFAWYMSRISHF
jgi:hypothetical protein